MPIQRMETIPGLLVIVWSLDHEMQLTGGLQDYTRSGDLRYQQLSWDDSAAGDVPQPDKGGLHYEHNL